MPFAEGEDWTKNNERDNLFAKKKMKLATPMGIRKKGKPLRLLVRFGEKEIKLEGIKCRRAEGCRVQKELEFCSWETIEIKHLHSRQAPVFQPNPHIEHKTIKKSKLIEKFEVRERVK